MRGSPRLARSDSAGIMLFTLDKSFVIVIDKPLYSDTFQIELDFWNIFVDLWIYSIPDMVKQDTWFQT